MVFRCGRPQLRGLWLSSWSTEVQTLVDTPPWVPLSCGGAVEVTAVNDLVILDLLRLVGFEASPGDRIVRHQHGRYPVAEMLSQGLFEIYQGYQSGPVFHKASQVVSLYGLDRTRACLFGVFRVRGYRGSREAPPLTASAWEAEWREDSSFFYDLEHLPGFEHLERRVIVDWGRSARSWCQRLANDKPVLEITAPGRRLPPMRDYLEFSLSREELVELFQNEDAHHEWRSRLSAVAGVYLILAETSGELYVGSASGGEGIWGRWREYARTGHGNNRLLKALTQGDPAYPAAFRYSILQILPKSMSREEVLEREMSFKTKLGCRAYGLNLN